MQASEQCSSNKCLLNWVRVLRAVALAILFGGSAAVVFAAIVLANNAVASGIPANVAATANAPVFVHFSKILLIAAGALLFAECVDFAINRKIDKLRLLRYTSSILCVATAMIFALGIVPPMAELLPVIKNENTLNPDVINNLHASFKRLHEISRIVFGGTILFSFLSMIIPIFECDKSAEGACNPPLQSKVD